MKERFSYFEDMQRPGRSLISEAASLARRRSTEARWGDSLVRLNQWKQEKRSKPVVFLSDLTSQRVLCEHHDHNFLFSEPFGGSESVAVYDNNDHLSIHVLKSVPKERQEVSMRRLASLFFDDFDALTYLGVLGCQLDQLNTVRFCSRCSEPLTDEHICHSCGLHKYPRISPCSAISTCKEAVLSKSVTTLW